MLCIAYVISVGMILGLSGLILERVLPAAWPRRWVWCIVIVTSVVLPPAYRAYHRFSIGATVQHGMAMPARAIASPRAQPAAASVRPWWTRADLCDPVINTIWLVASSLLLLTGLGNMLRVSRILGASHERQVVDGIAVVVTDSVGPATVGIIRSRLLVPRWTLALPGVQRYYVLRHEEEHRRAHDASLLFLASLSLVLLPWNLALWWQLRRLHLAIEMDCDHRVVSAVGDADAYAELLLDVAETASRSAGFQPAFLGGAGMLERRLRMLVAPTPIRHLPRMLLSAVAVVLLYGVLVAPHPVMTRGAETAVPGSQPALH